MDSGLELFFLKRGAIDFCTNLIIWIYAAYTYTYIYMICICSIYIYTVYLQICPFFWKGLWFQRVECSELILLLLDMDTEVLSTCVPWLQRSSLRMEVLYEWLQLPEFLKRTHSIFLPHCLPSGECNFLKESMCDFSLIPWDACRARF